MKINKIDFVKSWAKDHTREEFVKEFSGVYSLSDSELSAAYTALTGKQENKVVEEKFPINGDTDGFEEKV